MHPILWTFQCCGRSTAIEAYTAGISAAALLFVLVGWAIAARRGLPGRRVFTCLAIMVIAAPVGARALHGMIHPDFHQANPVLLWSFDLGCFAFQGAVVAALAAGLGGCRLLRIDPWRLADAAAPAAALGIVSIRLGCFLNGCCFGQETRLPWGVTYPSGSLAHLYQAGGSLGAYFASPRAVHPAQLYEVLAAFAVVPISLVVWRRSRTNGTAFLISAIWLAACQWAISLVRAPIGPPSTLQSCYYLFHVGFMIIGIAILLGRWQRASLSSVEEPGRPSGWAGA